MTVDLAKLGRFIADQFDLDQLQALCQELGVAFDQLLGETLPARAFDLVTLMRDQGQLSALVAAVAQARPDAFSPQDFQVQRPHERAERGGIGRSALLGGGLVLALLVGLYFLLTRKPASAPAATSTATMSPTLTLIPSMPPPSPTPSPSPATPTTTIVTPTTTPIPATPTASPTPSPSPSPTPAATATFTPTLTPSATPVLSPSTPPLSYDAETRILELAPGARLCTPLNAYHLPDVIYVIESIADGLELPLPAQARITHSYPERLADDSVTRTVEMRRHPREGIKVTGEEADFLGCYLVVSEDLRLLLGFPANLGEFNDPPRFDHGWVIIEFLTTPQNP